MFSQVRFCRLKMLASAGLASALLFGVAADAAAQSKARAVSEYGKLPLRFEANRGQAEPSIDFLTHGRGYGLSLTADAAVLSLQRADSDGRAGRADVVRIEVAGSTMSRPVGEELLPGIVNYIESSDRASWKTNIPTYAHVRYRGVYRGIDLVYYGKEQQLEYDFIVAPGAQASEIRLHFDGARRIALDDKGSLLIEANHGSVGFHKPVIYQTIGGRRHEVDGAFTLLANNTAGFRVGRYDHAEPLVIDPTLLYSTYVGGTFEDSVTAMAVDGSGNAYLTGTTLTGNQTAGDFPTTAGAYDTTGGSGYYAAEAFVSKLNASGSALLYSTYLGPNATTAGIAIDASGDAYVTGITTSATFPTTTGVYQPASKVPANYSTGFVTKLNPTGTALVFSTYLGGSSGDTPTAIQLSTAGNIYVAGYAFSADYPTTSGVYQPTNHGAAYGGWNNFVTELNPAATALVFSTFLGGGDEYSTPEAVQLALDSAGNTYVASLAIAADFPTTAGAYETVSPVKAGYTSMTLSKFNPAGTMLLYSTYFDGAGAYYREDQAKSIAVDGSGNVYLAGITYESMFPVTSGALQTTNKNGGGGLPTGFITKFNSTATALVYSTFLGGSAAYDGDTIDSMALDASGDVYVGGSTGSTDFPVTSNAYQTTNLGANNNLQHGDAPFLTELNPAGSALLYSTFFGSADSFGDAVNTVALGPSSTVYIAGDAVPTYLSGVSGSTNFPITSGAFQTTSTAQQGNTGFVAKFNFGSAPTTIATTTTLVSSANPAVTGSMVTFNATVAASTGTAIPTGNVVFSVDNATVATVALNANGVASYTTPTALSGGTHAILASYAGNTTFAASAQGLNEAITPPAPTLAPVGGVYTSAQLITLADTTAAAVIYYTLDGSTPSSSSTKYTTPFLVSTPELVLAIAIAPSLPSSTVAHGSYSFLSAPAVLAAPASAITTTGATLNAIVSTGGMAGTYSFAYGTSSTSLTSSTPATAFGGSVLGKLSIAQFPAATSISGLVTHTTYYFKVIVTTNAGVSSGEVLSFTTN